MSAAASVNNRKRTECSAITAGASPSLVGVSLGPVAAYLTGEEPRPVSGSVKVFVAVFVEVLGEEDVVEGRARDPQNPGREFMEDVGGGDGGGASA
jgi:hypothetical protein